MAESITIDELRAELERLSTQPDQQDGWTMREASDQLGIPYGRMRSLARQLAAENRLTFCIKQVLDIYGQPRRVRAFTVRAAE